MQISFYDACNCNCLVLRTRSRWPFSFCYYMLYYARQFSFLPIIVRYTIFFSVLLETIHRGPVNSCDLPVSLFQFPLSRFLWPWCARSTRRMDARRSTRRYGGFYEYIRRVSWCQWSRGGTLQLRGPGDPLKIDEASSNFVYHHDLFSVSSAHFYLPSLGCLQLTVWYPHLFLIFFYTY